MRASRPVASPNRPLRAAGDSGMLTHFTPSQHVKPAGWLAKVQNLWNRIVQRVPDAKTTQQGSTVASPSMAYLELISLRFERRQVIADARNQYDNDPRCRRSVDMYVREAVRRGVIITVEMPGRGVVGQRAKLAQEVCKRIEDLVNNRDEGNPLVESWGRMAIVEGDLFVQIVADLENNEIVDVMRMPASSMERNTDDTDHFTNHEEAYSNVDVLTNTEIANYPEALIWHGRWRHIDGDRYGNPEFVAARRPWRLLEMCEEARARRDIVRAPQRLVFNIGTADKPSEPQIVKKFKEENGFVEGVQEQWDPVNIGQNFFGNGLLSVTEVGGDPHAHQVDYLLYLQNILSSAGYPTPGPLYNLDAESVNRDVLDNLQQQWYLETQTLSEFLQGCIRRLVDVGLMLAGILPETVNYTVHFSESTIEKPGDIIDRVLKLFNNGHGQGLSFVWVPLISWERAITMISEFMDIDDVKAEQLAIERMLNEQPWNIALEEGGRPSAGGSSKTLTAGETRAIALAKNGQVKNGKNGRNGNGKHKDDADEGSNLTTAYRGNQKDRSGAYTGNGQAASNYNSSYGEMPPQTEY